MGAGKGRYSIKTRVAAISMAVLILGGFGGELPRAWGENGREPDVHEAIYIDLTGDGKEEMVTIQKGEGTSSLLSYQVWHGPEGDRVLLLERGHLYQGVLRAEQGKIIEQVPAYREGDANALPSGYWERVYSFTPQGASLMSEEMVIVQRIQPQGDWQNPPRAEIEAMLRRVALDKGIPPVILQALAYAESNLRQFHNGQPLQSFDKHSWGIMQVSPAYHPEYDIEMLKYDIEYNMRAGAEIFLDKWTLACLSTPRIPKIGTGDPRMMENWYFALWAYNGWVKSNNPNTIPYDHGSWVQNEAYQCKVLRFAREQFYTPVTPLPPEQLPAEGLPAASDVFPTPQPFSYGEYRSYAAGDIIIAAANLTLRNDSWQAISPSIPKGTAMQVLEGPVLHNGFIRYKIVTLVDEGSPRTGWVAMNWTLPSPTVDRIFGVNRYHTAVEISQAGWDEAETVLLARGDDYADALAGVPLAYTLDAPILLTQSGSLTAVTQTEIARLKAGKVIILGGTAAVSQAVEDQLQGQGLAVERISGPNRYATAALIAAETAPQGAGTAVLASGLNFPDALAAAPYAAASGMPILLTQKDDLPAATQTALNALGVQNVLVIGGDEAISQELFTELPAPIRISGPNRYATAVAIAQHFDPPAHHFYVATGLLFADAITGGVLAAKNQTGILLVGDSVPTSVADYINLKDIKKLTIFGGTAAVSQGIEYDLQSIFP